MPLFSRQRKAALAALVLAAVIAQPTAAQAIFCANCGSEFTQLLNYATLVEQYVKQAAMLQQSIAQYKNMVANSQRLTDQQWSNALAEMRAVTAIFAAAKSLSYSSASLDQQFSARYGTYDSYVSAKSDGQKGNGQTMAAKYKQWSEETNATTLATLKAAGLQSSQIEGGEQGYIQYLEAQATSAQGRLDAIQTGNQIAVEGLRQTQKLRQLMFANLQLEASFIQTQQDQAAVRQANDAKYFKWTDVPENNGKDF